MKKFTDQISGKVEKRMAPQSFFNAGYGSLLKRYILNILDSGVKNRTGRRIINVFLLLTSIAGVVGLVSLMLWMFLYSNHGTWQVVIFNQAVNEAVLVSGECLMYLTIFYFLWLFYLAFFVYREYAPVSDAELPVCTVIVPAYNEGRHVRNALASVLASDYPADKLDIIAVNDGSTDDTLQYLHDAVADSGNRIRLIDQPRNKGKRQAIYDGVQSAAGSVIVTIDSDSVIAPGTLRSMISPLVCDAEIGGVAGNVAVMEPKGNGIIPHVLDVNFVFSFDFIRAAQSAVRAVFCAPGALTAFRKDLVINDLEPWLNQQFMGHPSNIGEDRALTNIILRHGKAVVFQRSALVQTKVPEDYSSFARMLIRWARSNVRENLDMLDFAFGTGCKASYSRVGLWLNMFFQFWWMVTPVLGSALILYFLLATLGSFLLVLIPVVVLSALLPTLYYLWRKRETNILGTYFYATWGFVLMFWIAPFSLFSVHRSGWLTRNTLPGMRKY